MRHPSRHPRRRLSLLAAPLTALALASGACSSPEVAPDLGYDRITEATGEALGAPTGDVVLTLTGAIGVTNGAGVLELDLDQLESMGLVEYAVDDPQALGRVATFRGVLLRDLLEQVGASSDADLRTIALNDYAVDIPGADAGASPVLVATSVDGERMPVDAYGPLRIVYPYASHDLDPTIHDPRWIWQLASIEVG